MSHEVRAGSSEHNPDMDRATNLEYKYHNKTELSGGLAKQEPSAAPRSCDQVSTEHICIEQRLALSLQACVMEPRTSS
jgi:hypothetical protein